MRPPDRIRLLGLPVDQVTTDEAVYRVEQALSARASSSASSPFRIVVTNANKAWLAHRDAGLRGALEEADLVVPEWATVWAARRLGRGPLEFVGGITLMRRLLEEAAERDWTVYLLGAKPGVASRLADRLERTLPTLDICGHHHGYLGEDEDEQVRRELRARRPDLLFVGMGSPLQERWLFRRQGPVGAAVAMGVGGSFDVLAGERREAPEWIRATGLEWLWRTAQDPWRLGRRYAVVNSWFVGRVLAERARQIVGD